MTTGTPAAEWRRLLVPPLILLSVVLGLVFVWFGAHSLLMLFAGMLFAVFLDACTRGLGYILPLSRAWRFGLVVLVLASLAALAIAWGVIRLPTQVRMLMQVMDSQLTVLESWLATFNIDLFGPGGRRRPVPVHRRSRPPVRPRPVRRERRLCVRHNDDRHRLPRPLLRRPAGGLSRRRAGLRPARRPAAHARGDERDGPSPARLATGPARAQHHRCRGAGGDALLARRAWAGPARGAGRRGQLHSLSRATDRRPAGRPGDDAARPADAGLGHGDVLPRSRQSKASSSPR